MDTGINGAGKSTTLQILTRDLQATSGNLRVEGKPITSRSEGTEPYSRINDTMLHMLPACFSSAVHVSAYT